MAAKPTETAYISLDRRARRAYKQGVALKGRNRTGPPCSVGRPRARLGGG